MEKYILTNEKFTFNCDGRKHIVRRIQAITTIKDNNGNIIAQNGDLGGFIEKPSNLSHEGSCWVDDDALVCGNAKVNDDALVAFDAVVFGGAKVSGHAKVLENAQISDHAEVTDYAEVSGEATVREYAKVSGHANVSDDADVSGKAKISGNAIIRGYAEISGNVELDKGIIDGDSQLTSIKNKNADDGRGGM